MASRRREREGERPLCFPSGCRRGRGACSRGKEGRKEEGERRRNSWVVSASVRSLATCSTRVSMVPIPDRDIASSARCAGVSCTGAPNCARIFRGLPPRFRNRSGILCASMSHYSQSYDVYSVLICSYTKLSIDERLLSASVDETVQIVCPDILEPQGGGR